MYSNNIFISSSLTLLVKNPIRHLSNLKLDICVNLK